MKEEQERTPLRTILQNFLNHIEKLDSQKVEGSYDKEFQELKLFSEILKTSKQFSCSQGEKEVNRKKNRYKDILPFDESRVILDGYAGVPGSDYINANYIKGASGSPAYIASQGPLPHTVNDFWRMVVECEVQVIVMACNEEEAGKHKCENYWVEREGEEKQFGMVAIRLIKASVVCPDFLVRTMRLKYTNSQSSVEERTVCQFHYSAWPDHGVPPLVRPLLDMVRLVRDTQASETLPVLVHCSAGCGRTGTICAIDYVWGLLRGGKLTKDFSLFKLVRDMRRQRIAMVQTKEQYILVHHAVKELFCEQLRMIDSHPYENIDVNGMPLVKESPEPMYATITSENTNEEKQDNKEKEGSVNDDDDFSPLVHKKRSHTAASKQEKEVENLTEKQRSIVEHSSSSDNTSTSSVGSLLQKPRIAKLKALFERSSVNRESRHTQLKQRTPQQVVRSHSLGAVRKVEDALQPIPSKGILRVPQLATVHGPPQPLRPSLPIKRSKSLKVLGSGERYKLSVASNDINSSLKNVMSQSTCEIGQVEERSTVKADVRLLLNSNIEPLIQDEVATESKPVIPPKKLVKEKVSDRQTAISNNDVKCPSKPFSSRLPSEKNCESTSVKTPLQPINCRRRSLESFTLDDMAQTSTSRVQNVCNVREKWVQSHINQNAQKLKQDSGDYVHSAPKCDLQQESSENKQCSVDAGKGDTLQNLTVEAQRRINAIVAGLGVRERRNSFRQAISTSKSREMEMNNSSAQDYEAIWLKKTTPHSICRNSSVSRATNIAGQKLTNGYCEPKLNSSNMFQPCNPSHLPYQTAFRSSQKKPHCCDTRMGTDKYSMKDHPGKSSASVKVKGTKLFEFSQEAEVGPSKQKSEFERCPHSEYVLQSQNISERRENINVKMVKPISISNHSTACSMAEASNVRKTAAGTCRFERQDRLHAAVTENRDGRKLVLSSKPSQSTTKFQDYKHIITRKVNMSEPVSIMWPNMKPVEQNEHLATALRKTEFNDGAGPNSSITPRSSEKLCEQREISRTNVEPRGPSLNESIGGIQETGSLMASSNLQTCKSHLASKDKVSEVNTLNHPALKASGATPQKKCNDRIQEEARTDMRRRWDPSDRTLEPMPAWKTNECPSRQAAVKMQNQKDPDVVSYGLVAGVQLRRGSRDDLALCGAGPSVPPRVRRHASVVLLRHSLIETSDGTPLAPLSVWNTPQTSSTEVNPAASVQQNPKNMESWGGGALGVDVDTVAASMKPRRVEQDTTLMRTLEALHLRKPPVRNVPMSSPQYGFQQAQSPSVKKQHYL